MSIREKYVLPRKTRQDLVTMVGKKNLNESGLYRNVFLQQRKHGDFV